MLATIQSLNWALIFGVLWGICETLALIPSIKSNSVFTFIYNAIQAVKNKLSPPAA